MMTMRSANELTKSDTPGPELGRRRFGTGILAALGGGLLARTAEGFPAAANGDFNAATNVLKRYGVSVGGAFDAALGHDVMTITTVPQAETQYDFVLAELNSEGGLDPCIRASSFGGNETFVHYAPGGIIPCISVAIEGPLMTYDLIDPHEGDIIPCVRVAAEHSRDGGLGPITITVDPEEQLQVMVGTLTYALIDGRLVDVTPPR